MICSADETGFIGVSALIYCQSFTLVSKKASQIDQVKREEHIFQQKGSQLPEGVCGLPS